MTIGELAKKAGVNAQTIRYYEREGLLPVPHRWKDSGYRDYDADALNQLHFIRAAKELGFKLREVRELLDLRILPNESCDEVRKLIGGKLAEIDQRMKDMRRLKRVLTELEASCATRTPSAKCPVLWAIEK